MSYNDEFNGSHTGSRVLKVLLPLLWIALGGAIVAGVLIGFGMVELTGDPGEMTSTLWTCPMHPEVIAEEPGSCPICGMDLVPLKGGGGHQEHEHNGDDSIAFWTCPMHPEVIAEEPGSCPICGMDLVPASRPAPHGVEHAEPSMNGEGYGAVVAIDTATQQMMNVTTARVERQDLVHRIRTVGYLDYDQERMVSVTTKYTGFIEKTFVSSVGQPVVEGETLFEIYSPDLVQTERELLTAKKYSSQMAGAGADVRARAAALVEAARERLAYWDVAPEQISEIERTGVVQRTMKVVAPASGLIMKRMAGLEGMAVRPGLELLHIADLSRLWLNVDVFEDQLPWLRTGSRADVTMAYFPGEAFAGRVRFIEPEVSEETRSVRLTLDVANRDDKLRVGMYATVVFEPTAAEDAITVPSNAVLRTGERNLVILALGDGRFAPREVVLGPASEGLVQVLRGLDEGEEIVTSAQFLIDSESNLKEAIQKMVSEKATAEPAGHVHGG